MKCRVSLTYTVELVVEGENEDQIQDWLNEHTPNEAYKLCCGDCDESYDDEILYEEDDDVEANYTIPEDEYYD